MVGSAGARADRRQRLAIGASYASMFVLGIMVSLLGPSLPSIAEQIGVQLARAGILFTLLSLGSLAATVLMARLMDHPIRHALVVAGALLLAGALWLAAASSSLGQIGFAITLAGFGLSTIGVAPNAIIAGVYGERSGAPLNILHLFSGVGSFVGPLAVGSAIRLSGSYRSAFLMIAGVALLLAALWAISRPPRPAHPGREHTNSPGTTIPRRVILLLLLIMLYLGSEQTMGGWIFAYAQNIAHADVTQASLLTSLFWLAILLGRLVAVQILRQRGNLPVLAGGATLAGLGMGIVLAATASSYLLWPGVCLVGLGFGPLFPTTMSAGTQMAPKRAGMVSSLLVASSSIGAMILPWTAGVLMERLGPTGSMASVELVIVAMLACLWAVQRSENKA